MKPLAKIFITLFFVLNFGITVFCGELQLSDYEYTNIKPMLDGYMYVESEQGSSIIKPDGKPLYDFGLYETEYDSAYTTDSKSMTGYDFHYPQNESGNRFIVKDISKSQNSKNCYGIMDENGQIISEYEYLQLCPKGEYYYTFARSANEDAVFEEHIFGLIDAYSGKETVSNGCCAYLSTNYEKIAVVCKDEYRGDFSDEDIVDVHFYNKGELYDTVQIKWADFQSKAESDSGAIVDNEGEKLYTFSFPVGEYITPIENGEQKYIWDYDFLDAKTEFDSENKLIKILDIQSERVDKSYIVKEKSEKGQTLYALFKNIGDEENAENYSVYHESKESGNLPIIAILAVIAAIAVIFLFIKFHSSPK